MGGWSWPPHSSARCGCHRALPSPPWSALLRAALSAAGAAGAEARRRLCDQRNSRPCCWAGLRRPTPAAVSPGGPTQAPACLHGPCRRDPGHGSRPRGGGDKSANTSGEQVSQEAEQPRRGRRLRVGPKPNPKAPAAPAAGGGPVSAARAVLALRRLLGLRDRLCPPGAGRAGHCPQPQGLLLPQQRCRQPPEPLALSGAHERCQDNTYPRNVRTV